ncbi:MAG: hypothetical protein QG656_1093 [Candidatus Hydrogenedentes bacterium]|nr:hypothetical protein [Candidatus Hydrogenedentota bacterium]
MDNHEHAIDSNTDHAMKKEMTQEEKEEIYARAMRRARMKMSLYIHATAFTCVILLLTVINLLTTPSCFWVVWPFFGWGIVLFLHWLFSAKLVYVYERIKTEEIAKQLEHREPK